MTKIGKNWKNNQNALEKDRSGIQAQVLDSRITSFLTQVILMTEEGGTPHVTQKSIHCDLGLFLGSCT